MKQRCGAILNRQCVEYGNVGGGNETPMRRNQTLGSRTSEIRPNKGKRRATHVIPFNFTMRSVPYPRMERETTRANGDANGSSILEIFEFLAAT